MANKKFSWIVPAVLLAFGLVFFGCDNGNDDDNNGGGGGGVQLPENLQNTEWSGTYGLKFATDTFVITRKSDSKVNNCTVAEATLNGKITYTEAEAGDYIETLCTSYVISDNTLIVTGGKADSSTPYTKVTQ
jgi:hypothetical protein